MTGFRFLGLLPAALVGAAPAGAQTNVIFDATVQPTCTLTVNGNGTMVPSADLQTLSSKLPGGSAGAVSLSTTGGVEIGVEQVTNVSAPAGDAGTTTWLPTYSLAGAHTVAETPGDTVLAAAGLSTVTVHLVGTKDGAHSFAVGTYQATVTVTCQ